MILWRLRGIVSYGLSLPWKSGLGTMEIVQLSADADDTVGKASGPEEAEATGLGVSGRCC